MTTRGRPAALLAGLLLCGGAVFAASNPKAARYYEDALDRYEKRDLPGAIVQLKNALQIDRSDVIPVERRSFTIWRLRRASRDRQCDRLVDSPTPCDQRTKHVGRHDSSARDVASEIHRATLVIMQHSVSFPDIDEGCFERQGIHDTASSELSCWKRA